MNYTLVRQIEKTTSWKNLLGIALAGSALITLCAWIKIPLLFTPVPITLQSFAIIFLATFLGRKKMALVMGAYLMEASLGLPVLTSGSSNPLWFLGPTAGFLLGFALVSYFVAYLAEKNVLSTYFTRFTIASFALLSICLFGTLYLSVFVGFAKAFQLGFIPFITGEFLKAAVFASIAVRK